METALFVVTAIVTVVWSIWNHRLWTDRAGLPEDSPFRLTVIAGPSAYFLFVVLAGWQQSAFLRLDLVGLAVLDILTAVLALVLGIYLLSRKASSKGFFVWIYVIYNMVAVFSVAGLLVLRSNPVLLIRVASLFRTLSEIELFSFAWIDLDSERRQQDVAALLNKVLIAAVSYVPVALIRVLSATRQQARIRREIELLKKRIGELENRSEI